ncbi:hypothetical protein BpHYR1_053974 [Brachionus plicatilis]|uniref:Uncharacterized protein n=1 Tax=Brachionus plicatilis TaxID=10195 RepID=A0A3M7PNC0_BRAPC|nr:hypothetical protein BpHYR1_053974 [Brachionus plicatilis]
MSFQNLIPVKRNSLEFAVVSTTGINFVIFKLVVGAAKFAKTTISRILTPVIRCEQNLKEERCLLVLFCFETDKIQSKE